MPRDYKGRHPLYHLWHRMVSRCHRPRNMYYPRWGGRGITVCDRWRESFAAFVEDMGPRPPGTSIERMDNDGPYAPWNCKWATALEQANNKRNNQFIEHQGRRLTYSQWAREVGVDPETIRRRAATGWPVEQVLTPEKFHGPSIAFAAMTHCRRGHPINAANSYTRKSGARQCRVCARDVRRAEYHRALLEAGELATITEKCNA